MHNVIYKLVVKQNPLQKILIKLKNPEVLSQLPIVGSDKSDAIL